MNKYKPTPKLGGTLVSGRRIKTEYCSATLHAKRDSKRIEAEDRNRARNARTPRQQHALLLARPGQSRRESRRLQVAMMAESTVVS